MSFTQVLMMPYIDSSTDIDMSRYGLVSDIVDSSNYNRSIKHFRKAGVIFPTLSELADPMSIPVGLQQRLSRVDPNTMHSLNLFRLHWYNAQNQGQPVAVPEYIVLPSTLTGVDAKIVMVFGNRFPMINAHKVLAAYACLVPRIVSGQFDPTCHRAIWPSTGNYARGGIAISRLMQCRGVAILPEDMSDERFEWLDRWVLDPSDVIRTSGSESNVKEIYDACHQLEHFSNNFILNQFSEFPNHISHYQVTGPALSHVLKDLKKNYPASRLIAFVAASGSSGTLGAGDWLKEECNAQVVAVDWSPDAPLPTTV